MRYIEDVMERFTKEREMSPDPGNVSRCNAASDLLVVARRALGKSHMYAESELDFVKALAKEIVWEKSDPSLAVNALDAWPIVSYLQNCHILRVLPS